MDFCHFFELARLLLMTDLTVLTDMTVFKRKKGELDVFGNQSSSLPARIRGRSRRRRLYAD
ncbi:hypothetical protein AGR13a_Lc110091 [Agrobacterium genomosp. 13 str. CFBP 6927]|uniref:Transposase n=1 Tax=Agrobacterium genomosp. 13 str. CFBP 6927 TaxID=1183428 RepID=A0ABM9VJC9_9HYPH|nr:hypothetical protein AGR13a_Lc110091 [Agrobacterium genomosp. 13 str. CFBP 6927]